MNMAFLSMACGEGIAASALARIETVWIRRDE